MARTIKRKKTTKRQARSKELNRLAYNLALIEKGKQNKDSQVYDSYQRGLKNDKPKKRKPLI